MAIFIAGIIVGILIGLFAGYSFKSVMAWREKHQNR